MIIILALHVMYYIYTLKTFNFNNFFTLNKSHRFLLNTSTFLLNGNFDQKIHAEKLQNHRHQSCQGIKESVHFKMLFVSSRYLNLFLRYRISKDKRIKHIKYRGKWMTARCIVTYFFSGSAYVANSNSKKYANSVFVTDRRICAALQAGQWRRAKKRTDHAKEAAIGKH